MANVTLYGTDWCPYCVRAEQLLARKGITPEKINIHSDSNLSDEMSRRSVPQIFIGANHVGGFDDPTELTGQAL